MTKRHRRARAPLLDHLEKVEYFAAVAEHGSFRRAAEALGVTQPALSRSVQILEEALDVELLSRQTKGVVLTEPGRALFRFSRDLLRQVESTETALRHHDETMAGRLSVGSYGSIAIYFWPKMLRRLKKEFPLLTITLRTSDERTHLARLKDAELDALVHVEPRPDDTLFSTVLFRDRLDFYQAPHSTASTGPLIYVPDAIDEERRSVRHHLERRGLATNDDYEVDTFETAKALAVEGIGISVLPERVAEREVRAGHLRPMREAAFAPFGPHRICATVLKERRNEPRLRSFLRKLKTPGD